MTINPQFRHPIDATALAERARSALPPDAPDALRNLVDDLGRAIGDRDRDLEDFLRESIAAIVIPSGFPINYDNGRSVYSIFVQDAFVGSEDILTLQVLDKATGRKARINLVNEFGFPGHTIATFGTASANFAINDPDGFGAGFDGASVIGVVFGLGLDTLSVSGTQAVNLYKRNIFDYTLTGNTTLTWPAGFDLQPNAAWEWTFYIRQDATGGRTLTWPTSVPVKWPGGTAPVITPAANAVDIIKMRCVDDFVAFFAERVGANYS